jgi:ADP-ribose pyrophosphatase
MKIPKRAKRVFQGEIFDTYQWKQKMFDGSMETFEMVKRPDTAEVIATQKGKVLISRESQPHYGKRLGFLGGRVDPGETPVQAAKRELLEEAGMISNNWELYKIYEPHGKLDWSMHYYVARDCRKVAESRLEAGEKINIAKVSFKQFIKLFSGPEYGGGEFTADILRMKLDRKRLKQFEKKLFG